MRRSVHLVWSFLRICITMHGSENVKSAGKWTVFISVTNQLDAQKFCFTKSFISCLYMFRAHVLIIRRSKLCYTASGIITPIRGCRATYRCDDTRCCVMQFWPPDDEHMCSKHVEAWNKLIVKQKCCASSWLTIETNILRCTVSKT